MVNRASQNNCALASAKEALNLLDEVQQLSVGGRIGAFECQQIVAAGFILAVALLATITLLCAIVPGLRSGFAYAWRVWLWSSLGCVVANVPVFALYFVPAALERTGTTPAPGFGRSVLSVVLAGGLLLGPIIASGVGFVGGAAVGLFLAARATRLRPS